jgi:hypothetical protein
MNVTGWERRYAAFPRLAVITAADDTFSARSAMRVGCGQTPR